MLTPSYFKIQTRQLNLSGNLLLDQHINFQRTLIESTYVKSSLTELIGIIHSLPKISTQLKHAL